jgi:Divergent InlB B-repeat domain
VLIVSNKFGSDTSKPAAHLSILTKSNNYFSFDISIIGKGSVGVNNKKFGKDTTLKFLEGTTFTVALIADSAYILSSVFVDNTLNSDAVSSKQYLVSTINQNHSINVSFTKLTGATPDSLFLISGVADTATGKIETVPNREKFAFNEMVTLNAKPAVGYVFAGWSGSVIGINISSDVISFKMDIDRSIMATFVRKGRFTLVKTIVPANGGTIKVTPDNVDYSSGAKVSVQAVPAPGYKFKSWSGANTSAIDTFSMSMDTNKTITATFEQVQVVKKDTLTVVVSIPDTNSGSVKIHPVKQKYLTGDTIQLIAYAKGSFNFVKWSGAPAGIDTLNDTIAIILASNLVLTPQFLPDSKFSITQTVVPSGSGEIILMPSQAYYSKGDRVKLTARPAFGFRFTGWSGASKSLVDTITLSVDTNIAIQANFEAVRFPLQCGVSPAGSGSVSKSDTVLNLTDTLTLTAIPNTVNGYEFKVWRQTGGTGALYISDSTIASPRMAVSKGPVILTAIFALRSTFSVTVSGIVTNGSIIINPVKQAYYIGDTITVTARPEIGYTFTSWTGDLTGTALTQKVTITKSILFNAVFTTGATIQDVPVAAGSSLNAEIKKVSALSIPGAILTPAAGKYDNNTIEILGTVTLPIQRR